MLYPNPQKKVIIIGGGIAGLTCARACLDAGLEVELYEKRQLSEMLSGAGGIFIQRNGMRVYQVIWGGKIYQQIYEQGGKILSGGFFNRQGIPLYINNPQFIGDEDLGVCLLRPDLQKILYDSLPVGIVKNGVAFTGFQEIETGVRVNFHDGSTTTGDILVGADGLYSQVRACLQGEERLSSAIYSGMVCWRGYFPNHKISWDDRYSWMELWGRGNRFGFFDVGRGNFSFYAFSNRPQSQSQQDNSGKLLGELQSIFADYGEPIPSIIKALEGATIYQDNICDRQPLGKEWGRGRVTLIGDAAHPVQPNLGQGGCMGIEDAFELAKILKIQVNQDDMTSLLRQFEQSRAPRVTRVFTTSRQVGKLGQTASTIGCFLRDGIYKLTPTWLGDLQFKWLFDYHANWENHH
ncbi:FAD-dependent oxidoreductase [Calothrix sp. 336/3]|uniref:FAD-dependent oxidoreductase n=1 Tax=Calothrix sp. 336/3 TaxID=1337936 RepID=UPI0004E3DA6F|nr:FAD-dependent oxidoreductase [Calothrix sp. 336/3]AKG20589.1 Zeaxanthin epoxidase [Calothrix sp. 336/3]